MLFDLLLFEHVIDPLKMLHYCYKQYLDGVFVISGISKVEADYTCRDLDFSGYNKNEFNCYFIILCF